MFRDVHGTGTLRVDAVAGSTVMFMTLGCSDLQHREAHDIGILAASSVGM